MSGTVNLNAPLVVASQNQKEVTINAALARFDAAITETFDANLTAGNITLTSEEYRAALQVRAINATVGGRTVTLPQVERIIILRNDPANTQSVGFVRGSTTLTLLVGETVLARTDGTTNGLVALLRGTGTGASVTVREEGTGIAGPPHTVLNFVGAGVTASDGGSGVATITISGGGSGVTLEDEGSTVTGGPHSTLNFAGAGVVVTNAGGGEATVTITGTGVGYNPHGRTFVAPTLTDFAWVNQGTATATQRAYGVAVEKPRTAANSYSLLTRAVPSTPYSIITAWGVCGQRIANLTISAGFRNSSSNLLQHILVAIGDLDTDVTIGVDSWTNPTTYSTTVSAKARHFWSGIIWLRLRDDGTDRFYHVSNNGDDWAQIYTVGRTSFLTPDQNYFAIDSQSATAGIPNLTATLLSWEVGT